jgi:hypothetical protein
MLKNQKLLKKLINLEYPTNLTMMPMEYTS